MCKMPRSPSLQEAEPLLMLCLKKKKVKISAVEREIYYFVLYFILVTVLNVLKPCTKDPVSIRQQCGAKAIIFLKHLTNKIYEL